MEKNSKERRARGMPDFRLFHCPFSFQIPFQARFRIFDLDFQAKTNLPDASTCHGKEKEFVKSVLSHF